MNEKTGLTGRDEGEKATAGSKETLKGDGIKKGREGRKVNERI